MTGNFTRFIIERAVDRALREMKKNSKRELRNLVELGLFHSIGVFQNQFFENVHRMLSDQHSPYYTLAFNIAANVDTPALKKFGMNLGYNAWTAGVRRIREYEAREGCGVPWMLIFDLNEEAAEPLTLPEIKNIVAQAREIGIFSYLFVCDKRQDFFMKTGSLLTEFQDCAFFLLLDPNAITRDACILFRTAGNGMPIIAYTQENMDVYTSAAVLLKSERCLYGSFLCYGGDNTRELLSTYSRLSDAAMPPATFLLRKNTCTEENAALVQTFIDDIRTQPSYPTFFVDLYRDFAYVDSVISNRPGFLSIAANGSVSVSPDGNALANIRKDGLASLLQRLLPRPALE